MPPIKAGIIIRTRFVDKQFERNSRKFSSKGVETFQGYIDYIDRDEAARTKGFQKYSLYNDYMDNPLKTSGLFTADKVALTAEE